MKITNWGNYPVVEAKVISPTSIDQIRDAVTRSSSIIARGLGRCYGDSSLNETILSTVRLNHILAFDEKSGMLTCEAGVSLEEILDAFVPRGWFLPVTPGTKFVTVGGAVASDVHGKNHHVSGSFSNHVDNLKLLTSNGEIISCSKDENNDLFWSTCGGMGLTGIILEVSFRMIKIETAYIRQEIIKSKNLEEIFQIFEQSKQWTYSVAWIDCLAKGDHLGRSVMIRGEHAVLGDTQRLNNPLILPEKLKVSVPFYFPDFALSTMTVKAFNELWYLKYGFTRSLIDYEDFFYPLDSILRWNKIYGKRGMTQYQCVLPKDNSYAGMKKLLETISVSGEGSFLAVLKLFGDQDGLMSFPREGYTLALDFPVTPKVLYLFQILDNIVLEHGGRLYLAKDARMGKEMFVKGYDQSEKFFLLKKKFDRNNKFQSLQSRRLGIG